MVDLFEYLNRRWFVMSPWDDTFMVYRKNVERFCELLLSKDLKMTWHVTAGSIWRNQTCFEPCVRRMLAYQLWHQWFSDDSGSKIKVTLDRSRMESNTAKAGIAPKGFMGHPRETRRLHATYNLTQSLPFADISVTCMTPFPGSPLARTAHEFGAFENDWTR